jgi:hypothetical protein
MRKKFIVTENQLEILLKEDRVDFLKNQNVIKPEEIEKSQERPEGEPEEFGRLGRRKSNIEPIQGHNGIDIAYIILNKSGKKTIKLTDASFNKLVDADPSRNKAYVEWLIQLFNRYASEDINHAVTFIDEDLDQATDALKIFDRVKEKKKFRLNAKFRKGAPENPKDIKQYKDVGQLYTVVVAFDVDDDDEEETKTEGALSEKGKKLYEDLKSYVKLGQAKIVYQDSKVIVYQPLTLQASCEPLGSLASWCTRATPSGGIGAETGREYFHSYRGATGDKTRLRPGGELSDYYVIMPLMLFQLPNPSSHDFYPLQFHFETNQLHHKGNQQVKDGDMNKILTEFPGLAEFLRKETGKYANLEVKSGEGLLKNRYIDLLNKFGGKAEEYIDKQTYEEGIERIKNLASEEAKKGGELGKNKYLTWLLSNVKDVSLVDYLPKDIKVLDFSNIKMDKLPDISTFKNVTDLHVMKCGLTELPNNIDELPKLQLITASFNNIKKLPKSLGNCKQLDILVLGDNPISHLDPEVIGGLFPGREEFTVGGKTYMTGDGNLFNMKININNLDAESKELIEVAKEMMVLIGN